MLKLSNKKNVQRANASESALIIISILAFILIGMYLGGAKF